MSINFELYKIFYMIAKEKQISKAAKKLCITQPAVSQSIKQLEEQLGGQLFIRTPRGVNLTTEGAVLFDYVEKAYGFITSGELKFQELKNIKAGEVVIGAGDSICSHYLLPYLEKFHAKSPEIKIKVIDSTTNEIVKMLRNGTIDIGLLNLPVTNVDDLNIFKTAKIEDCFIAGAKYSNNFKEPVDLAALAKYPLLLLDTNSNTRKFVNDLFWQKNLTVVPEIELGSNDLLVKFTKIGLGVTFVSKSFVKKELAAAEVVEIKLLEEIPRRMIGVSALKEVNLSPSLTAFMACFQSEN